MSDHTSNSNWVLWAFVIIQAFCATVFVWDIVATILGLRSIPISWRLREILEIAASVGLVLGAIFAFRAISDAHLRASRAETALQTAAGAFSEVVEHQFQNWALTKAEKDVAWFTLKGFSLAEIAKFRGTSEGTIKAQTNRIYSKAGVNGKAQLLSYFVEDLLVRPDLS